NDDIDKTTTILYTPLNGTGHKLVGRALRESGLVNEFIVPEQEKTDPDLKILGYPNREEDKELEYAIRLGKETNRDILLVLDQNCDRVACMGKDNKGAYKELNGNQIGALLVNYILSSRAEENSLPENAAIVKSIVTGDLSKAIADKYGVKTIETLTGFKHICGK